MMPTSKRKMSVKRWKQPKIIDKWSNRLIGGAIKQPTFRVEMKVSLKRQFAKIFYKSVLILTSF